MVTERSTVTKSFEVRAPDVARKAQAGQFVIVRVHDKGERIPLTIADYDRQRGTLTLVVQEVGNTVLSIVGVRSVDLLFWEERMHAVSDELIVALTTQPFGVPTIVNLNSIMVDGTGMCGACRVEAGEETRFACVDGPEFDGHQVDWDLLMARQRIYLEEEKRAVDELVRRMERLAGRCISVC
jgi:NAD(P)H-flavin reductase